MKTDTDYVTHAGNLGEDRVRMVFDEDSIAHLQSVLIGMYGDPALAVIREYSTNAWDSHKEAGSDAPIEVTLPNMLSPLFVVRDFGVGMSVDMITQQFSRYGWSSKRHTDEQSGMLGLGCKSGLAFTSQFTIVSVRDGVRATVLITREGDGGAALQVVDTCGTEEPNGVTVTVPVPADRVTSFTEKAKSFYQFWDSGAVSIDGKLNVSVFDEAHPDRHLIHLDPDVVIMPWSAGNTLDESYVVMGGVPYPMDALECMKEGTAYIAFRVPIGTVNFAPNRESLTDSKRTREALSDINAWLIGAMQNNLAADVQRAESATIAMERAATVRALIGARLPMTWQGERVPFGTESLHYSLIKIKNAPRMYGKDSADSSKYPRWDGLLEAKLIISDCTLRSIPPAMKQRARLIAATSGILEGRNDEWNARIAFTSAPQHVLLPWCEDKTVVSYTDLKAIPLPGAGNSTGQRVKPARFRVGSRHSIDVEVYLDDIDDTVVAWIGAGAWKNDPLHKYLDNHEKVLIVRKSDEGKIPDGLPILHHLMHKRCAERLEALAPEDAMGLLDYDNRPKINYSEINALRDHMDELHDQELVTVLRTTDRSTGTAGANWVSNVARQLDWSISAHIHPVALRKAQPLINLYQKVMRKYPTLHQSHRTSDRVAELNALAMMHDGLHLHPSTY